MSFDFNFSLLESSYAAIAAALFGGVGVRLLDKLLTRRSENFNEGSAIRKELREELETLRHENEAIRQEADMWRAKYWTQVEENVQNVADINALRAEKDELVAKLRDLDSSH